MVMGHMKKNNDCKFKKVVCLDQGFSTWGTRTPGGTWDLFRGYENCRICIILLETVGADCMWLAEPIGRNLSASGLYHYN